MTTETAETRITGPHQALERYAELLAAQPAALSPQVREALAWARLEDESTPLAWEGARKLATTPDADPVKAEPGELPEYRPDVDRVPVSIARRGTRDFRVSVPTRWALEYGRGQEFMRERLKDGTLIYRPVEVDAHEPIKQSRTKRSYMTTDQVREVRSRLAAGQPRPDICREMRLTAKQVGSVARGKTFQDV